MFQSTFREFPDNLLGSFSLLQRGFRGHLQTSGLIILHKVFRFILDLICYITYIIRVSDMVYARLNTVFLNLTGTRSGCDKCVDNRFKSNEGVTNWKGRSELEVLPY